MQRLIQRSRVLLLAFYIGDDKLDIPELWGDGDDAHTPKSSS
jgi:hypothetical protein